MICQTQTATISRPDHRVSHITNLSVIAQQSFFLVEDFLSNGSYRDTMSLDEFNSRVAHLTRERCKFILEKIKTDPRLIRVEKHANPISTEKILGETPKHEIFATVQLKIINITSEHNTYTYLTNQQFTQLREYESKTIKILTIRKVAYYAMKAYSYTF